ncbi:hypothetical protein ACIG3E_28625 [Streptomyces sp. NPDC053474]|uniref:hypothetical protein n=1 Tax=Streptomyces sp. NPDC053474 TaxID=3365704 RepID=UPI0037D20149
MEELAGLVRGAGDSLADEADEADEAGVVLQARGGRGAGAEDADAGCDSRPVSRTAAIGPSTSSRPERCLRALSMARRAVTASRV